MFLTDMALVLPRPPSTLFFPFPLFIISLAQSYSVSLGLEYRLLARRTFLWVPGSKLLL